MDIRTSLQVAQYLRNVLENPAIEEFWVLALNQQLRLIDAQMVAQGTVDSVFVHPRDVFRVGLVKNAAYLVVGHNHPRGGARPSSEDLAITHRLCRTAELLQMEILDHVIVTSLHHFSFADSLWSKRRPTSISPGDGETPLAPLDQDFDPMFSF